MRVILIGNCAKLPEKYIVQRLPLINGVIAETDDLSAVENCGGVIYENTGMTAQMDKSRKTVNRPRGYTGRGITVCVLDTGAEKTPDIDRISVFKDFVNGRSSAYDDNGHGTHVCGIIAGSGKLSGGRYAGIAPKADLIVLKTLDSQGKGNAADVLSAMQWISDNREKYNIRLVNLSIGTDGTSKYDPLVLGAEALWDRGIAVITAAGNNGPHAGSISAPGTSKKVITVGCYEDGLSGLFNFGGMSIKDFSGRGPTSECIIKPDLVAPGSNIVSCGTGRKPYRALSGTSMSTPMVTGAAALLLEKEPSLTPNEIKLRLKRSCTDLELPQNQQGWGLLNIKKLLEV